MDVPVFADQQELNSIVLLEDLPAAMDDKDWRGERESQGNPCSKHDLMMIIDVDRVYV